MKTTSERLPEELWLLQAAWQCLGQAGKAGPHQEGTRGSSALLSPRHLGTWGPGGPGALFAGKQWDPILAQHKKLIRQFIACHFSLLLVASSKNKVAFLVYLCIRLANAAILLSSGTEGCAALQTLMVWQVSLKKDWKILSRPGILLHLFFSLTVKVASEWPKQLQIFFKFID